MRHRKPQRTCTWALINEHAGVKGGWELTETGRTCNDGRRQQSVSMNSTNDEYHVHEERERWIMDSFRCSVHTGRCRCCRCTPVGSNAVAAVLQAIDFF